MPKTLCLMVILAMTNKARFEFWFVIISLRDLQMLLV